MPPLIGVTPNFDPGDMEPMLPGRRLLFTRPEYLEAVVAGGGLPVLLPLSVPDPAPWLDRLDGLLVTGNEKPLPAVMRTGALLPPLREQNPVRYDADAAWIRGALDRGLPVLGLCRGMQTLNAVLGGSLHLRLYPPEQSQRHNQPLPDDATWHGLQVAPDSRLGRLLGPEPVAVNSFHAQGVHEPGSGLRIVGRAPDGVVEAIEGKGFCLGLQFHPELLLRCEPRFLPLFTAFVVAAANRPTN